MHVSSTTLTPPLSPLWVAAIILDLITCALSMPVMRGSSAPTWGSSQGRASLAHSAAAHHSTERQSLLMLRRRLSSFLFLNPLSLLPSLYAFVCSFCASARRFSAVVPQPSWHDRQHGSEALACSVPQRSASLRAAFLVFDASVFDPPLLPMRRNECHPPAEADGGFDRRGNGNGGVCAGATPPCLLSSVCPSWSCFQV
jgi:hypothetical protein